MIRCSCGAELFSIESICSVCIPSKPPRALFVEDLRIKLANRELEILDWKEAVEIANAENDDLRREVAATTKHAQLLNKMLGEAADALEAMAGERDKTSADYEAMKAHNKELFGKLSAAELERDRLKAALSKKLSAKARQKLGDFSESMIAMGDGHSLEMLLNWYDESRKALGGKE